MLAGGIMRIGLFASWPWIRIGRTPSVVECFLPSLLKTKSIASDGEEKQARWDTCLLSIFIYSFLHRRLCLDRSSLIFNICSHFTKFLNFIPHAVHPRKPGLFYMVITMPSVCKTFVTFRSSSQTTSNNETYIEI